MSMKTDRCNELLKEFKANGIPASSESKRFPLYLEFQDVIGRASFTDLQDYYGQHNQLLRGLFIWVCATCLSMDTFLDIIKQVVCQTVIADAADTLNERLHGQLAYVDDELANIHEIKLDNAGMVEKLLRLESEIDAYNALIVLLRGKADRYDQIRRLLR